MFIHLYIYTYIYTYRQAFSPSLSLSFFFFFFFLDIQRCRNLKNVESSDSLLPEVSTIDRVLLANRVLLLLPFKIKSKFIGPHRVAKREDSVDHRGHCGHYF